MQNPTCLHIFFLFVVWKRFSGGSGGLESLSYRSAPGYFNKSLRRWWILAISHVKCYAVSMIVFDFAAFFCLLAKDAPPRSQDTPSQRWLLDKIIFSWLVCEKQKNIPSWFEKMVGFIFFLLFKCYSRRKTLIMWLCCRKSHASKVPWFLTSSSRYWGVTLVNPSWWLWNHFFFVQLAPIWFWILELGEGGTKTGVNSE